MRTLIVLLVLLSAALAGCFGGDDTVDHDDNDPGHDDAGQGNETAPPAVPPQPNVTVDVDFGEAPLTVIFTLDDDSEDDAEREWTFTVDGNGTADAEGNEFQLPFEFTFTYEEPGLYTATFTITSGNDTVTANRLITVEAAEVPEFEDRGWYIFETATGHCHVKEYETHGTGPATFYVSAMSGGTWIIAETNGVEGLQAENNFPDQTSGQFSLDIPDCVDGDQVLL